MEKHTALPWQAKGWGIFGNSNHPVAEMIVSGRTEATANARYIITACNAYPALVEALERVEQAASHSVDCTSRHPFGECDCFKSSVANALALAKGEQ